MSNKKFFVTTPIYYSNGIPHIGHAYSSLIADVIARYKKINGYKTWFSTGVDENSQKVVEKAQEEGMEIMEYADLMASKHKEVWDGLNICYTDFVRTTEDRHQKLVQEVLQISYNKGDIYEGVYEGLYCVGCEAYKKPSDLTEEGLCPDHLKAPEKLKEKNWFFKLSKYQDALEKLYTEENTEFVIPENRFKEVKEFVKGGLEDFSVSRESNKFGIKLPFDESQVSYVWYDALFNYVTTCLKGGMDFWPADLHIVGKDIIRFHAVYWPAMLMSAGYELPKNILTTGFFTVNGQKISKSLGNVIDPVDFSHKYSRDLMLLYLFCSFNIGQDGDFSEENAIAMYNAKLANNLGNLLNRFTVLSLKVGGEISKVKEISDINLDKNSEIEKVNEKMNKYDLKGSLDSIFEICDTINTYANTKEPWKMISEGKEDEAKEVLYNIGEGLRVIGILLYPFFTEKMSELFEKIGLGHYKDELEKGNAEELLKKEEKFIIKEKGEALYPRI